MKLNQLRPVEGSTKERKRVGRGKSSGHGKTSGRGQKGQKSRSGKGLKPGFEGGQMPIHMRLPKLKGFKPLKKVVFQAVNCGNLSRFEVNSEIGPEEFAKAGLIKSAKKPVKILGGGEISIPLTVKAHSFSKSASEKLVASGGKIEVI